MRWWLENEKNIADAVVSTFKQIEKDQEGMRRKYATYLSLYENRDITSLDGTNWATGGNYTDFSDDFKENVIRAIVDALAAKISSKKPRPYFLTVDADWKLQKRAKLLSFFVEGVFKDQAAYKLGRMIFRDALLWGMGLIKISSCEIEKKIILERTILDDIKVDFLDGKYGKPKSFIQQKTVAKEILLETYPEAKNNIELAGHVRKDTDIASVIDEPVSLFEAWHLPSRPNAKDGKRILCTDRGIIEINDWNRPRFPFAVFSWKDRSFGWHAQGVVEELLSHQRDLDWYNMRLQRLMNSCSIRIFTHKGSAINTDDLTNEEWPIIEFVDQPPVINTDPGPSQELFMERERMKRAAFEQVGISQLSAQSQKPSGLSSGQAIREYKDTESERFIDIGQNWEDFYTQSLTNCILDEVEDLAERTGDVKILSPVGNKNLSILNWKDVSIDRDKLKITSWPASLLPREPAGRIESINEMMQLFPQSGPLLARQLDNPDVDAALSLVSAPVDSILSDIERLQNGEFFSPEPFIDMQTAKVMVLAAYLKARNNGAPEEVLEAFRNYLISIQDAISQMQQQQMALTQEFPNQPMDQGMPAPGGTAPVMPPGGMPPGIA